MDVFQIDTTLQLTGDFIRSADGQLVDPSQVFLFLQAPNTAAQELVYPADLTKLGVGKYAYVFTPSASGMWTFKWQGTGVIEATSPDKTFTVQPSALIPG